MFPLELWRTPPHYSDADAVPVEITNTSNLKFTLFNITTNEYLELDKDFSIGAEVINPEAGDPKDFEYKMSLVISGKSMETKIDSNNILSGAVKTGDELELTAIDTLDKMKPVSKMFKFTRGEKGASDKIETINLVFIEQGMWDTTGTTELDSSFNRSIALVFDLDDEGGKFVDRVIAKDGVFTGNQIPEGNYKVVFIENYQGIQNVPNLSYLTDDDGGGAFAFVDRDVEIKDGIIERVDVSNTQIPDFDARLIYVKGTLRLAKSKGVPNYTVKTTVNFAFDKSRVFVKEDSVDVIVKLSEYFSIGATQAGDEVIKLDGNQLVDYQVLDDGKELKVRIPVNNADDEIRGELEFYS